MREELRSASEELRRSKQELQTLNAELATLNEELREKNRHLDRARSDLQNLIASSETAAVILDPRLTIQYFTPAAAGLFPLLPADIGRPFRRVAAGIDWEPFARDAAAVLSGRPAAQRELETLEKGRSYLKKVLPYRTAPGRIEGVVVTFVDLTERRRAEELVERGAEQHRLALEGADLGSWDYRFDAGEVCWDERCRSMWGVTEGDTIDYGELISRLHEDDRAATDAAVRDALSGAKGGLYQREFRVVWPDGSTHWVASHGRVYFGQGGGRPVRFVGVARDISLEKRAEAEREALVAEVKRGANELDAIFNVLPYLVSLHGKDGRYLKVNPKVLDLFGLDPTAATRQEIARRLNARFPDGRALTPENMPSSRALAGEAVFDTEYVITDARGEDRTLSISAIPLQVGGEVYGSVLAQVDVTERRKTETALRESEERLRLFFEHAPASLAMFDRELRYLAASRRWLAEYGLGEEDPAGRSHYEVCPQIPEAWREAHGRALAGEVVRAEADRLVRADGRIQWVRWEIRPWRRAADEVGGVVIFTEDVTEILAVQGRLDLLSRTAAELLRTDFPRRIVEPLCREVMDFLGCDVFFNFLADESTGRLRLHAWAGVPEEEARRIEWLDYGVAVCGCVARDGCRIVAEDVAHAGDPRTDLVRSYGVKAYACHPLSAQGRLIGTLSFGTKRRTAFSPDELSLMNAVADQVSIALERERVLEILRESEERFRAIFERHGGVMLLVDPDTGAIVDANAAAERFYGLSRETLLAQSVQDINMLPPEEVATERRRAAVEERGYFLFPHRAANGEARWVEVYSSPIEIRGRKLLFSVIHDVTERRRAEAELIQAREAAEAASRAKGEFLAMMSHEIRTPMNGILGMTELALTEAVSPKVREYLTVSKASAAHLLGIINNVLDLARIEARGLEVQRRDFDLLEAVDSVVSTLSVLAAKKGLKLEREVDARVPRSVRGDSGKLAQVLVNILGNSIKFTERGGISLSISCEDSERPAAPGRTRLLFGVTDTGIGIPGDRLCSIFESFSQATASHHTEYGGTGLGLSIAKHLVELMGGRIWVESEVGAGSTFFFTLELDVLSAGVRLAREPAMPEEGERRKRKRLRVLLAEDNPVNRLFAEEVLRRRGDDVVAVTNGREALEVLSTQVFDLVLMDVQMPEMDGLEASRAIRDGRVPQESRDVPIVALTAHALKGDRERFLAAGMDDYLSKPIDLGELDALLDRWGTDGCGESGPPSGGEPDAVEGFEGVRERLRDLCKRMQPSSVWRLVDMALEQLGPGLGTLDDAVRRRDAETVAREAHALRGAWVTVFGSSRIVDLAEALERRACAGCIEEASPLVEELRREASRLSKFVEAEQKREG